MPTINMFQPTRILSAANATDLVDWIHQILDSGAKAVLIDLRHVLFIDHNGLDTLVTGLRLVQKAGGRFALCALSGQARMMLEVSGVELLFEIYNNSDDFKAALCAAEVRAIKTKAVA